MDYRRYTVALMRKRSKRCLEKLDNVVRRVDALLAESAQLKGDCRTLAENFSDMEFRVRGIIGPLKHTAIEAFKLRQATELQAEIDLMNKQLDRYIDYITENANIQDRNTKLCPFYLEAPMKPKKDEEDGKQNFCDNLFGARITQISSTV